MELGGIMGHQVAIKKTSAVSRFKKSCAAYVLDLFGRDPHLQCPKCRGVFFLYGCCSCGDEMLSRDVTRITS